MTAKTKAILRLAPVALLFAGLCLACWFHAPNDTSLSERRPLAQFPEITVDAVLEGDFMTKFDSYSMDQFPLRESFRKLKSFIQFNLLGQKDINGIYIAEDSAAKIEGPVSDRWVTETSKKLEQVYNTYFKEGGSEVFFALIPDKSFFLAEKHGYPGMDYDALMEKLEETMGFAQHIDLTDKLDITDYYATDSHWRQECIGDAAQAIADALGVNIAQDYKQNVAREDFSGVYAGQSALPLKPETMYYLTSPVLDAATVYDFETGKTTGIYDLEELWGRDPYDLFLSGAAALQTIENPNAETDRELIIFRDSFGSSMAPLLVPGYTKVTLVDLRYMASSVLGNFLEFHGQDVLFLYSPGIMNSNLLK